MLNHRTAPPLTVCAAVQLVSLCHPLALLAPRSDQYVNSSRISSRIKDGKRTQRCSSEKVEVVEWICTVSLPIIS